MAKVTTFPSESLESTRILVINIAVNSEVAIPINKVVANPLIGPVPKINKIKAVNPVVMLASKMDDKALLNPSETAFICPFPFLSSSRIHEYVQKLKH